MKPLSLILFAWSISSIAVVAEDLPLDYPQPGRWKDMTVPSGAEASLALPVKALIGEQIPAKLVIKNTGERAFEITTGGDYRATGFPQRMKVRVRDGNGQVLRELTREHYGMGGGGLMGRPPTIAPGSIHEIEFPLERYVSFPKAGIYTVTAGHDLGWQQDKARPHPVGVATIAITEPTPEQADGLVKSIIAGRQATPTHVAFQGTSYPPMREEAADYVTQAKLCVLRHPIYHAPLKEAAETGCVEAVSGLGHITTAEATETLIGLLGHDSPRVQSEALNQLRRRLPSKDDPSQPALRNWSGDVFQIDPLLPASWKPEFEQRLSTAATGLLAHGNTNVVSAAAQIIEAQGGEECAPALIDALQRSLDAPQRMAREERGAMYPPMPEPALLSAMDALRKRGWRAGRPGRTAQMVAWFRQLADKDIPKPDGADWQDDMLTWVTNGPATLKENALRAIPLPMSESAVRAVLAALEDDDPRVLRAACDVAGQSKLNRFIQPLIQIIEIERVPDVHQAATIAGEACGGRVELWKAVASSIVVKEHLVDAVRALIEGTIDLPIAGGGGGNSNLTRDQRFKIRGAWFAFLKEHENVLAQGKKVPQPNAAISAALTGADLATNDAVVQYRLHDGLEWPRKIIRP